ncbi:MAG: hypothetical protein GXO98_08080 [Nitrospirae bacterium]|nr:hypothetical protein [Nitrospirota bacterium]
MRRYLSNFRERIAFSPDPDSAGKRLAPLNDPTCLLCHQKKGRREMAANGATYSQKTSLPTMPSGQGTPPGKVYYDCSLERGEARRYRELFSVIL